jgi:prepilin-type N-terminal cleavage/methylation domain-containing protein
MDATRTRGFSLIEIMVALTILAITLGGFAAVTFRFIRNSELTSATMARGGVVNQQVQRLSVMPFDSLSSRAGCSTIASGPLPYRLCIAVADVNGTHKRVTVVVIPANTRLKPDTTVLDRTKPLTYNALHP